MKVTVLNEKKKFRKDDSIIFSIVLLVLGIFLACNAEGLLNIIFDIIGGFIIAFGLYRFTRYSNLKSQFNVDDTNLLISAITAIAVGLLVILLSNVFTNAIKIITGICLLFTGINKLSNSLLLKDVNEKNFIIQFISSIIIIFLGIYTLVSDNVVFIFIGIILIIYSILDIINYIVRKR